MTITAVIRRMNASDADVRWFDPRAGKVPVVPHGSRSTFRDWAAEETESPNELVEMALAHAVGNKVEAAYRRGNLFERRRKLTALSRRLCHFTWRKAVEAASLHAAARIRNSVAVTTGRTCVFSR